MPYLDADAKRVLDENPQRAPQTAGELTYRLQQQLKAFLTRNPSYRYEDLAAALGALEGAKLDLVGRIVEPYEAKKQAENGDVWLDPPREVDHPLLWQGD